MTTHNLDFDFDVRLALVFVFHILWEVGYLAKRSIRGPSSLSAIVYAQIARVAYRRVPFILTSYESPFVQVASVPWVRSMQGFLIRVYRIIPWTSSETPEPRGTSSKRYHWVRRSSWLVGLVMLWMGQFKENAKIDGLEKVSGTFSSAGWGPWFPRVALDVET